MTNRINSKTTSQIILVTLVLLADRIIVANSKPTTNGMPAMAAKAGGRLRPELLENKNFDENDPKTGTTMEIDYYDYNYDPEKDCNGDQFWHDGGKQCVPKMCNFGRDQETGKCLNKDDGRSYPYYNSFGSNYSFKR